MSGAASMVHVVDDDEAIRHPVGFMLRRAGHIVATYASGSEFAGSATRATQGCVLLDLRMPEIDGLEVQARLTQQGITLPVIMLTAHGDVTLAVRAVKAGPIEFLEKPFEQTALLGAINEALRKAEHNGRGQLAAADAVVRLAALTARERDVLGGMVLGLPNKLIAYDLGIATRPVEVHRANLMDKIGARSLSDVLRVGFAAGLGDIEPA